MKITFNPSRANYPAKTQVFQGGLGEISYEYAQIRNMDKFIKRIRQVVKNKRVDKKNPWIKALREQLSDCKDLFKKSKDEIIKILEDKHIIMSVFDRKQEILKQTEERIQRRDSPINRYDKIPKDIMLKMIRQINSSFITPQQKNEWELIGLRPKRVTIREGKEQLPEKIRAGYVSLQNCEVSNIKAKDLHMNHATATNSTITRSTEIYGGGLIDSETGTLKFSLNDGDTILKNVDVKHGEYAGYWKDTKFDYEYVPEYVGVFVR